MQYVGRVFSRVSEFYKDINPSTLSGAIDIVVVENKETGELSCSPFHVRFGKMQLLRPQDKIVDIAVNGKRVENLQMKVGEGGETFFVVESEASIPEQFLTSPLNAPVQNEEVEGDMEKLSLEDTNGGTEEKKTVDEKLLNTSEKQKEKDIPLILASPGKSADINKLPIFPLSATQPDSASSSLSNGTVKGETSKVSSKKCKVVEKLSFENPHITALSDSELETLGTLRQSKSTSSLDQLGEALEAMSDTEVDYEPSGTTRFRHFLQEFPVKSDVMADTAATMMTSIPVVVLQPSEENLAESLASSTNSEIKKETIRNILCKKYQNSPVNTEFILSFMSDLNNSEWQKMQISLCGEIEAVESEIPQFFNENLIDFENFQQNNNILYDNNCILKFKLSDSKTVYIPSKQFLPLFYSYLFYKKLPSEEDRIKIFEISAEKDKISQQKEATADDQSNLKEIEPTTPSSSGWISWWQRGKKTASNSTNNLPGETSKQPSSPVSKSDINGKIQPEAQEKEKKLQLQPTSKSNFLPRESVSAITSPKKVEEIGVRSEPASPPQLHPVRQQIISNGLVENREKEESSDKQVQPIARKHYAKSLRLTSEQLKSLNLQPGVNTITFSVGAAVCNARIFLWKNDIKIVISDIDGTITKSDALGHLFTFVGKDWTHSGVANLYTNIKRNGYELLYLTSRAIGQADSTRLYLKGIEQGQHQLPDGPVIMSPDRLLTAIRREVIVGRPQEFKIACLKDIQRLFGDYNPFYAGFGNRITDALSYKSVKIPTSRIFTINPDGTLKHELIVHFQSTYIELTNLVDSMFPPVVVKSSDLDEAYNDYNYWKMPIPDLPALAQWNLSHNSLLYEGQSSLSGGGGAGQSANGGGSDDEEDEDSEDEDLVIRPYTL